MTNTVLVILKGLISMKGIIDFMSMCEVGHPSSCALGKSKK